MHSLSWVFSSPEKVLPVHCSPSTLQSSFSIWHGLWSFRGAAASSLATPGSSLRPHERALWFTAASSLEAFSLTVWSSSRTREGYLSSMLQFLTSESSPSLSDSLCIPLAVFPLAPVPGSLLTFCTQPVIYINWPNPPGRPVIKFPLRSCCKPADSYSLMYSSWYKPLPASLLYIHLRIIIYLKKKSWIIINLSISTSGQFPNHL